MRRLLVVLGVLVGLGVVMAILVAVNLNSLAAANRDRIVAGMTEGFGRPVTIEGISVGFHAGIAIEIVGLRIADDPAFATDDFLAADRADVVVRFWPLLERRVEIRRIAVRSPRLTIIRTAQGMNIDSLGRRPAAPAKTATVTPPAGGAQAPIPAFAIALLNLEGGTVRYVDRTGPKPVETLVEPLEVRLSDLSVTTPVRVEVHATTKSGPPAMLKIAGTVGPVGDPPFATDVPIDAHLTFRSDAVRIDDLIVAGHVRRTPAGTPIASVRMAAPEIRSGDVVVSALEVSVAEADGVATLEQLAFGVFGGTIAGKGRVDHTAVPAYTFETAVRGVDVAQALAVRVPEMAGRFTGLLDAEWAIAGSGADEAAVRRSLTGKGHVVVRDGALHGVNVAEDVLTGVTGGLRGLVSLVPARVRDRYPAIFATDDTRFDELSTEVRVGGERIQVESFSVASRDYALHGKGVVTFARQVDLTATLVASAPLTADIVSMLKEAKVVTDDAGRVAIPFRCTGVLPNVHPRPDADFVAKLLQKTFGDGLDRLLGGGSRDPKKPDAKRNEGKDLLKNLDKLFGR